MKFKAHFLSALMPKLLINSSLLTLASSMLFAFTTMDVNAQQSSTSNKSTDRWFEIEVILFTQLGDKSTLKEHFPKDIDDTTLPLYTQYFDLLTTYLHPDISAYKQFLPLCNNANNLNAFTLSKTPYTLSLTAQMEFIEQSVSFQQEIKSRIMIDVPDTAISSDIRPIGLKDETTSPTIENEEVTKSTDIEATTPYIWQNLALPIYSTSNICVYQQADFDNLLTTKQLENFDINNIEIKYLPKKLNASGNRKLHAPYLMADENLLLNDIPQRLGWSKKFKPLLHFGWRQIGVTRSKAIPLKVFAGKHIEEAYQRDLKDYQLQVEQLENQPKTETLSSVDDEANINTNNDESTIQRTEDTKKALASIFSGVKTLDQPTTDKSALVKSIIDQLSNQSLDDLLAPQSAFSVETNQDIQPVIKPEKPLQPWFLDGFIKVHLDHYLYVTADFNLLTKSSDKAEQTSDNTKKTQLIHFSQDRRVITGEVHYFDHPYIGMIVQIRRFDPTKPDDEAVSQAIK